MRINPNRPFLKTSYSIDRDYITFEILEQDDFTRGNFFMHIFTGKEVYESIKIESVACPDISYNIYICAELVQIEIVLGYLKELVLIRLGLWQKYLMI